MKTDTKSKNGNNAMATLAELNAKIAELQNQRIGLAQPLIEKHSQVRAELTQIETQIRDLDPTWKPAPLKPRADEKIREVIVAHGKPMAGEDIIRELANVFSPWKIKNVLKKRSTGPKAVFSVNDGKYSVKS